jgi:DNA helicase MCM8
VATLARFFSSEIGFELVKHVRTVAEREVMLELDYVALKARADIPDLFAALEMAPAEGLPCLRAAVHEVVFNSPVGRRELPGVQIPAAAARVAAPPRVDVHLVNVPDSHISFGELRSRNVGRLVSVRGTVTRVSPIKPLVVALRFACEKCEMTQTLRFADGRYREPEACVMQGCRGRKFAPDHDSVKCVDSQRVRIQELAAELAAGDDDARAPRFAELELQGSLCDACEPGEVVTALGVVETAQVESSGGAMQRQRDARMYDIYLNVVSVVRKRGAGEGGAAPGLSAAAAAAFRRGLPDLDAEDAHFGRANAGWLGVPGFEPDVSDAPEMSPSDLEFIVRFTEECAGEQFKHLVHSLCPTIYGQDMVKAGMLLSLFGGVRKKLRGSGDVPVRGSIHCLVVGDPGLGKSQLLKAASGTRAEGHVRQRAVREQSRLDGDGGAGRRHRRVRVRGGRDGAVGRRRVLRRRVRQDAERARGVARGHGAAERLRGQGWAHGDAAGEGGGARGGEPGARRVRPLEDGARKHQDEPRAAVALRPVLHTAGRPGRGARRQTLEARAGAARPPAPRRA